MKIAMRLIFRAANPSSMVDIRRCALILGAALLLAPPSWAQTAPSSDPAPAAASELDPMLLVGSIVAGAGLLGVLGFGGAAAFLDGQIGVASTSWEDKRQSANWGLAMLGGMAASVVPLVFSLVVTATGMTSLQSAGAVQQQQEVVVR